MLKRMQIKRIKKKIYILAAIKLCLHKQNKKVHMTKYFLFISFQIVKKEVSMLQKKLSKK